MKLINYKITGLVLVLMGTTLNSCKNLTDGYSTDPVEITDPSVISIDKYLSGIEISLIAAYEGDIVIHAGIWSDYFSGEDRQFIGVGSYIMTAESLDNTWQLIYNSVLKNHLLLEEKAVASNNYTGLGISRINLALAMGLAADLWGDIPYTEAGKFPAILNPKYDSQSSVYAAVQKLLDEAIANLNKNMGRTSGDFFFSADQTKWIKAAHSAKARYYLHTRDYQKAISEALLGIGSADGNLMAPHGTAIDKDNNFYYAFLYNRDGYLAANSYAPTLLDSTSTNYRGNSKTIETARLRWYYTPGAKAGKYDLSATSAKNRDKYSGFFGIDTSFPLLTFEETKLILAEAYMKQGTPDPDKALAELNALRQYYKTGAPFKSNTFLKKFLKYDDYVMADFAVGGLANTKREPQNTALLREILEERYVSFIGQFEGWSDMRRTKNFLNLPLASGKTDYPKRMLYPQIEVNTNTSTPTGVGTFTDVPAYATPY